MVRLMPMNMNVCRAFSPKGSKLNVMSEFLRISSTRAELVFRPFYMPRFNIVDDNRKFR